MGLPAGWETTFLTDEGYAASKQNVAFMDYWHRLEGCGETDSANWNPTCQGGTGGFLDGRKDVAPWYDAFSPIAGLWIAGFKQEQYGAQDLGVEIQHNTPDLVPALSGKSFDAARAAGEMQARGTSHASASDLQAIFSGATPGPGGNAPPAGGGGGPDPTGCHTDSFTISGPPKAGGDFSGVACTYTPGGSQGIPGAATGYPGTLNKDGTQCCVAAGASGSTTPGAPGTTVQDGCVCISIPSGIPIIGGDLKTCLLPQGACDFFGAITSEAFWIRAGEIILGLILLVIGLRLAVGRGFSSAPVQAAAKTAATVAK